ncbi:hypothetical protein ALC57_18723 [Trachymyrmex cornetzi]|uniref:Reverse transcriptase domain-containing protein n=1 Tax=Trachymyrmex cornetzi TaxID=471704 RepID=A0A151IR67_9HYME|nr:hypothetical protein ALC57_18723 [Trachymyrmex cornetzi]
MDDTLDSSNPNTALERRAKYIQGNRALDLVGHFHCDVFNQDKFLINGVEVRMRLVRSKDSFCLMETRTMSKIRILDASLLVRRAKISPGFHIPFYVRYVDDIAMGAPLDKTSEILQVFNSFHPRLQFTMEIGGSELNFLDVTIIKNNNTLEYDCCLFFVYILNFFSLYIDGMQIPSRPLQPNFSKDEPLYVETYHTIFSGTGIRFLNEGNSISRDDYANSYTLFAFDLTPDPSANCAGHWNLVKHGSLRLKVRFEIYKRNLRRIMEWQPRQDAFRSRGRPPARWTDDIKRVNTNWIREAQDRNKWKIFREAYIQQWTRQAV